jgi:hypothetical protein
LEKKKENEQKVNTIYFAILAGFLVIETLNGTTYVVSFLHKSAEDSSTTSHLHPRKRLFTAVSPVRLDFSPM